MEKLVLRRSLEAALCSVYIRRKCDERYTVDGGEGNLAGALMINMQPTSPRTLLRSTLQATHR